MMNEEKKPKELYKSSKRFYLLMKDIIRRDLVNEPYKDLNKLLGSLSEFNSKVSYITNVLNYGKK